MSCVRASGCFSELTHDSFKIVIVPKVNYYLPGIVLFELDINPGTQLVTQVILKRQYMIGWFRLWGGRF